jgi:hypothetical protein
MLVMPFSERSLRRWLRWKLSTGDRPERSDPFTSRDIRARVLITGGAGYVGSHCAKALAAAGHEGVVFDNLLFGHRNFVRWGRLPFLERSLRLIPQWLDQI